MSEMVERVARAIWLSRTPHGVWEARMSWFRATDEEKESARARGTHPGCFDANEDIESAFRDARAAIAAMREPTQEMLDAARDWSAKKYGKPVGDDGASGCYGAMLDEAVR